MAKRSRRPSTPRSSSTSANTQNAPSGTGAAPAGSGGTTPTSRTTRSTTRTTRPRRAVAQQQSVFDRYRTLIIGGAAVIGLLIVGWLFFQGSTGAAYACDSQLTPGPVESVTPRPPTATPGLTASPSAPASAPASAAPESPGASTTPSAEPSAQPSAEPSAGASASPVASGSPAASATPEPEPTARLGFTTTILGRGHILNPNQTIEYGFCPPTSGDHYNVPNRGPIRAAVYPKTEEQAPGGWIHNLEHGWVVALYRCTGPDDCPSDSDMQQLQAFFDQAPPPADVNCAREVMVARFDKMDTPFAMVAWGRALLMDKFDLDTALTFAQQWMDSFAPENGTC